jgi:hypothetical protein
MIRATIVTTALLACLAPALFAWNETGHRLTAAIAYDNLTPQARARVDALLVALEHLAGAHGGDGPAAAGGASASAPASAAAARAPGRGEPLARTQPLAELSRRLARSYS